VLFKTRVGLCVLNENIEIYTFKSTKSKWWWLAAQLKSGGEMEGTTFFGRTIRLQGAWVYLAAFADHAGVDAEIGHAMQVIADAFVSSASICDLSQIGSGEAWSDKWKKIQWP
jgi:hypothetical protein